MCVGKIDAKTWLSLDYRNVVLSFLKKNLSAMQEILVQFLGRDDPLEKG